MHDNIELSSTVVQTGSYHFDNLVPGTYTIVVSKKNYAASSTVVTLAEEELTHDITLFALGDATCDGNINIADVSRIYSYVRRGQVTENTVCSWDVNGDGNLNILDVAMVYMHVKGSKRLF